MVQQLIDNVAPADNLATGANKINANFTELYGSIYNVKHFGALGTGSSATQDQAGFAAAFAAAGTTATSVGVIYVPAGNYTLSGGFTQGGFVVVRGEAPGAVTINHTGNNVLFNALGGTQDYARNRGWENLHILGNSGSSAKGIVHGNSYAALFRELSINNYTAGTGLELANSVSWTEGSNFDGVRIYNCAKNVAMTRSGTGTNSFSDTRMTNCTFTVAASGQVAWWIDPNCYVYGSTIFMKMHIQHAQAIGLQVGAGSVIDESLFALYSEVNQATTAGYGAIKTGANSRIRGKGSIYPYPNNKAVDDGGNFPYSLDPTSSIQITDPPGDHVKTLGPVADNYYFIATLPISGSGTMDKLMVEMFGGPDWGSGSLTYDRVILGNRGGFAYQFERRGSDTNGTRANLRVVGYSRVDGSVDVYLRAVATTYSTAAIKASSIGLRSHHGDDQAEMIQLSPASATVPTGTIVFDSGNTVTYPPNASLDIGAITSNSRVVPTVLTTSTALDFPSVSANVGIQDLTVSVTGAAVGDAVALGPPTGLTSGLIPFAWVSAANTVTVRLTNISAAAIDPASATWRVTVLK